MLPLYIYIYFGFIHGTILLFQAQPLNEYNYWSKTDKAMSAEVTGAGESSSKVAFSATSDDEAAVDMDRGTVEERMGLMDENKVPEFISMYGICPNVYRVLYIYGGERVSQS